MDDGGGGVIRIRMYVCVWGGGGCAVDRVESAGGGGGERVEEGFGRGETICKHGVIVCAECAFICVCRLCFSPPDCDGGGLRER